MPNNNPQGHNQYTKRKEQAQQAQQEPGSQTKEPRSSPVGEATAGAAPAVASGTTSGMTSGPAKRGFAAMDEATQRTIASKGGQSQGKENNPGNFANDRDRAREAGRKGGESHGANR
jgi:general stress protein YciG